VAHARGAVIDGAEASAPAEAAIADRLLPLSGSPDAVSDLLRHADAASLARTVAGLQRGRGNRATGRLLRAVLSRKETGISEETAAGRYVAIAKTLHAEWDALKTPEGRVKKLTDAALAELKTVGVPAYAVAFKATLGAAAGQFDFPTWTMDVGRTPFEGANPGLDAVAELSDTIIHESRHCEQWFRMARRTAGKGKTAAEVATLMGIPQRVADEAVKAPLTAAGAELTEAETWWESVYGAKAADRNKVLDEVLKAGAAYNTAEAHRVAVAKNPSSTKADIDQATKDRDAAYTKFAAAHAKYTALPEEADAWKIGLAVKAAVQKPAAAK
jgi:hypothetical protein